MSRRTWQVYVIGVLLLLLIITLAIPFYAKRIPLLLEESASRRLQEAGINWAGLEASGRDITISGNAPSAETYQQALQTVQVVPGIRQVIDHMTPRLIKPYTMTIEWNDGKLSATGFLPDEAGYKRIGKQVAETYGSSQTEGKLQLALGNPTGWVDMLETVLIQMHSLEDAHADITDQQIYIAGKAALTTAQQQFTTAIEALEQQGFTTELHVIAGDTTIRSCQTKFNELMQTPILFESGGSAIHPDSYSLLTDIVKAAALCASFNLTIAGHTDNEGSAQANQKLSEQRAQTIANWLIREGIEDSRITVTGYGSSQPVADNTTETGRAKNRRIEFIVQGN